MEVATGVLTELRRRTLDAACDTFAPALETDADYPALRALHARKAADLGIAALIELAMAQSMVDEEVESLCALLDGLAARDFAAAPLDTRTALLQRACAWSHEAKLAVSALRALTLFLFYALPSDEGRNPSWEALGYPGPLSAPPAPDQAPKTIPLEPLEPGNATLTADACVIGSGAGGSVVAARLAEAGSSVVVLELGGYQNEADFNQLELKLLELYLRGGMLGSEDGSIGIFAGSALGGGTVVNYMTCIRPPARIREEWERLGIEGMAASDFSRHVDAVWDRLGVRAGGTRHNVPNRKLIEGLAALGLEHRLIARNADPSRDDARTCGYCVVGCQRGCKRSTTRTYLQDAADAGARFVVGAFAERILTRAGRATGVEATVTHADGRATRLTVEAPTVVVACGAIESPALLLRSGIGGPAVGRHLRLHPGVVVQGVYDEPVEGWLGHVQSAVSDAFAGCEGDWGFLVESATTHPGFHAMHYPFSDGRRHKDDMARVLRHAAPFIGVARDHGSGEVALDRHGRALVRWSLDDPVDRRVFVRAQVELARLHRAAGAKEVFLFHRDRIWWREGEDFDAFLERVRGASLAPGDPTVISAHQMGSCRIGSDPADSVAGGRGELHDTRGVWIGDASAFPTAPGVNPMITIMALAQRTAESILAAAGA